VRIGFFISDDASQIYKSLGISGASHTREESQRIWQAIIDQVNARGGLAGHPMVASYAWIDADKGSNASRSQAACAQFTQDQRVVAVVIDGAGDLSMATCLAQHRTPAIDVGQTSYPYDDADLSALAPYLYLPGRLSMGRFATYVDQLAAHGFFAKGSKVGLLRFDLPDQQRTRDRVIVPALARHGLRLETDVAFTPVEGTSDLPRAANEANNAVLRMRRRDVDRVLFLGSGLSLPYVFPTVAESQHYRPLYGITSDDGPDFMATNAPKAQLTGAMAVGWEPQYDVPNSDAVLQHDALWRQCAQVMRRAGFTPRDGRRCTAVYFLERALRGGSSVTPQALRAGAGRLGPTPYSTQTYATSFVPGRYDGVGAVRVLRFVPDCTCFRYLTGDVAVPHR
jgi:ABC-type branched-subunit amino acid transport system substrate-binding protein